MPLSTFLVAPLALYATAVVDQPRFDAIRFFSGSTAASGMLKEPLADMQAVRVRSQGYVAENGTLVIEQQVTEGDASPERRVWQLREVAPGRYTGWLSEAEGPVTGESVGDRLHLRYRTPNGTEVDQWMIMAEDGRSAQTLLTATLMGIQVARLQETIRKMD